VQARQASEPFHPNVLYYIQRPPTLVTPSAISHVGICQLLGASDSLIPTPAPGPARRQHSTLPLRFTARSTFLQTSPLLLTPIRRGKMDTRAGSLLRCFSDSSAATKEEARNEPLPCHQPRNHRAYDLQPDLRPRKCSLSSSRSSSSCCIPPSDTRTGYESACASSVSSITAA